MNRVPQYVHVATPNRSTAVGGAPQFGQVRATGPWRPAGTIGCWIGGGGGRVRRWRPPPAAIATTTITIMNTRTTQNGANATAEEMSAPMNIKNMAAKTRTRTTTTRATRTSVVGGRGRGGTQYGAGPTGIGGGCTRMECVAGLEESSPGTPGLGPVSGQRKGAGRTRHARRPTGPTPAGGGP